VRLHVARRVVTGATVNFAAPYAIESAHYEYAVEVPQCHNSFLGISIDRDAPRGQLLSAHVSTPFATGCARRGHTRIQVYYEHVSGGISRRLVGEARLTQPPGTLAESPAERRAAPPHLRSP
jgi:hypothetical protein